MWHIKDFEIKKNTIDITGSGLGKSEVSKLVYENWTLINAIEFLEFGDAVQLIICEHCGNDNCAAGNWVCFCKSGNYVLLIPAFELIENEDDWYASEYSPPEFYDKKTRTIRNISPYFDLETFENLRKSFPILPPKEQLENLKMSEAMRLAQYNFPIQLFDEPPKINFDSNKRDLIVGASVGDIDDHLQTIEQIIKNGYKNEASVLIRKPLENEEIIELFIYADEFIEWQALAKSDENYLLMLDKNFVIEPQKELSR